MSEIVSFFINSSHQRRQEIRLDCVLHVETLHRALLLFVLGLTRSHLILGQQLASHTEFFKATRVESYLSRGQAGEAEAPRQ